MKKIFTLISLFVLALSVQADNETYTLDLNKVYQDAVNQTGDCANATLNSGTKYLLNDATVKQDPFTIVSKSNRTYRIDVIQTDAESQIVPVKYSDDYSASYRLEPNGASNNTGGRQTFLEAEGAGKLTIGAWGSEGRKLAVLRATDKTSYYNVANASSKDYVHAFTADESKPVVDGEAQVFVVDIPDAGIYCITQDAGIYFGYMSFTETGGEFVPSDPTAPTTWDFTKALSDNDAANLAADANTWTFDETNNYWKNATVLAERNEFVSLTAGNAVLDVTKGLTFARDNSEGLGEDRVRIKSKNYIAVNGSKMSISLGELVKDDVVKIKFKNAGSDERYLTVSNTEVVSGSLTVADQEEHEVELKVLVDNSVIITTSNGFQFMAITVNAELPTGVNGVKAEGAKAKVAGTVNLAGQQVGADYKGIVVKDGKKVMQ